MPITTNAPRRIAGGVGTIPASTSIAGTVTVNTYSTGTLDYTGNVNLYDYITQGNTSGDSGYVYIVCADAADKIARVKGVVQQTATTWNIQVDGDMTGASSSSFSLITTALYGYSYLNDGGAAVTVNGISIPNNEGESVPPPDRSDDYSIGRTKVPLYVDATGSSVLIQETIGPPAIN